MYSRYLIQSLSVGRVSFTFNEIVRELDVSVDSAKSGLSRLRQQGKVISPAKGLYVIVPAEHQLQGSIPAEELVPIIMRHLGAEYYVSLLSGALYHGASHQKPGSFQVVCNKRIKHPLVFGKIKLELIYKKVIDGLPTIDRAVRTGYLKIASPELVALDLMRFLARSGGLNHIATVLSELIEAIDADKLVSLADDMGELTVLQRIGYVLDQIDPMETEKYRDLTDKLQRHVSAKVRRFIPLAPELATVGCARIKRWKVIENTVVESDL